MVNDALENNNYVKILILCTDIEKSKIIKAEIGPEHILDFPLFTFKDYNGDEILNTIEKKIENNENISERDMMFLTIIPFTNLKTSIDDAILKAADLTNKIKINEDRLEVMKGLQFTETTKFASKEKEPVIIKVIKMNSTLFDLGIKEGIEQGIGQGIEQRNFSIAKIMLDDNSSIDKIMKYTGLSEKEIKNIK